MLNLHWAEIKIYLGFCLWIRNSKWNFAQKSQFVNIDQTREIFRMLSKRFHFGTTQRKVEFKMFVSELCLTSNFYFLQNSQYSLLLEKDKNTAVTSKKSIVNKHDLLKIPMNGELTFTATMFQENNKNKFQAKFRKLVLRQTTTLTNGEIIYRDVGLINLQLDNIINDMDEKNPKLYKFNITDAHLKGFINTSIRFKFLSGPDESAIQPVVPVVPAAESTDHLNGRFNNKPFMNILSHDFHAAGEHHGGGILPSGSSDPLGKSQDPSDPAMDDEAILHRNTSSNNAGSINSDEARRLSRGRKEDMVKCFFSVPADSIGNELDSVVVHKPGNHSIYIDYGAAGPAAVNDISVYSNREVAYSEDLEEELVRVQHYHQQHQEDSKQSLDTVVEVYNHDHNKAQTELHQIPEHAIGSFDEADRAIVRSPGSSGNHRSVRFDEENIARSRDSVCATMDSMDHPYARNPRIKSMPAAAGNRAARSDTIIVGAPLKTVSYDDHNDYVQLVEGLSADRRTDVDNAKNRSATAESPTQMQLMESTGSGKRVPRRKRSKLISFRSLREIELEEEVQALKAEMAELRVEKEEVEQERKAKSVRLIAMARDLESYKEKNTLLRHQLEVCKADKIALEHAKEDLAMKLQTALDLIENKMKFTRK